MRHLGSWRGSAAALTLFCVGIGASCQRGGADGEFDARQPVMVKFHEGLRAGVSGGAFTVARTEAADASLAAAAIASALPPLNEAVRAARPASVAPVFDEPGGLQEGSQQETGRDLTLWFSIVLPAQATRADADALVAKLSASPLVETAYLGPKPVPAGMDIPDAPAPPAPPGRPKAQ